MNTNLYLGPKFTKDFIKKDLDTYKNIFENDIEIKQEDNMEDLLITLQSIDRKKIIGVFRDRLEWGARL